MGGEPRCTAAAITMHGGGDIAMDGGSGNGQRQCNGRRDGKAIAMGNGMAASQWTAQWATANCHQGRSGAMGGDARWRAAAITMHSGGKILVDNGSGNGQWRSNGRWDGEGITIGDGTAAV